jgi:O-antigen/teichoic acid export membrane protein
MGFDFIGIMLAFVLATIVMDLLLIRGAILLFRKKGHTNYYAPALAKDIVRSGMPAWIPNILTVAGQSIGILILYGVIGGAETGVYYIALAIASIVYALPVSIHSLMYPVLSGMTTGRDSAISQAIRLSLVITVPIAFVFAAYSSVPFLIMGQSFSAGPQLLSILALGAVLYPIYSGYYGYLYAVGQYKHVLVLGSIINGTRLILYYLLVTMLSSLGVALSYVLGILIVVFAIIPSAKRIGYNPQWRCYLEIVMAPLIIMSFLLIVGIHWIIGGPILVLVSFFFYTRRKIVRKNEVREISQALMSENTIERVKRVINPVIKLAFGE